MTLTLSLQPRRPALLAGLDNALEVLVRAEAAPAPEGAGHRRRLDLALVIDRSGSMAGQPLAEAKRLAAEMVARLDPRDRIAIVTYDDAVQVPVPSRPVGERASILAAIAGIEAGGSTALHAGWAAGAEEAARAVAEADVARVLLLSDGCANHGLTDPDRIAAHCREMAEAGVSTSTYG
ncbi:MAG: vWA domain-containing protein, partial [Thermaurantiacus tibetensis]